MTPPVRIGNLTLERVGDVVRVHGDAGRFVEATVEEARRLQSIGLPAVLPPEPVNGLAAVRKQQ
jgi:hypothetical protein